MAKTAYVYPQPALKPVAAPVAAPAKAPAPKRGSQPAPDSTTMAKAILGARIAQYVMNDPVIAGDWLALVALCRAGLDVSDRLNVQQTILTLAVGPGGPAAEGSTVFGMETTTGGFRNPWWREEYVTDGGGDAGSDGSGDAGTSSSGSGDAGISDAGSSGSPADAGSPRSGGSVVVTGGVEVDPGSVDVTGKADISGSTNGSWWPTIHVEVHASEHSSVNVHGKAEVNP